MIRELKTCVACIFISTAISVAHSADLQGYEENIEQGQQLTKNGLPRQRKRINPSVKNACDECRRRHVSCNEVSPGENCNRCKRRNVNCTWIFKELKEAGQPISNVDDDFSEEKEEPEEDEEYQEANTGSQRKLPAERTNIEAENSSNKTDSKKVKPYPNNAANKGNYRGQPLIFRFRLDSKPNGVSKKPCAASEQKSAEGPLSRADGMGIHARNPATGSEGYPADPKYIRRDAPYSSGAYDHPFNQNQGYSYQQSEAPPIGNQFYANPEAYLPANSSGHQNAPAFCPYCDTGLNQYTHAGQVPFEMSPQILDVPCNAGAAYPQQVYGFYDTTDDYDTDYEIWGSHEVCYDNGWQ